MSRLGDDAELRQHHSGVTGWMPVPDTPSFCFRRGKSVGDKLPWGACRDWKLWRAGRAHTPEWSGGQHSLST